ncbi:MAG: uracil-DNA glycosylase [Burkholderiales bacterium]|nr:uracil-DNA glycosylase [Burkholderiales bacterium]
MRPEASPAVFDPGCRDCARLAGHLDAVRVSHPAYYARPVPPFGDPAAALLIVGLAPGMHGANRTGRPFTGDYAGILLYRTLHAHGFANHAGSADPGDGLQLTGCRITNAVKCLPPQNKPTPAEARTCNRYLAEELRQAPPRAILALGRVAHDAVLMAFGLKASARRFAHHAIHDLPDGVRLFDSYHCSRYNTQTRRLTEAMFDAVVHDIAAALRPTGASGEHGSGRQAERTRDVR